MALATTLLATACAAPSPTETSGGSASPEASVTEPRSQGPSPAGSVGGETAAWERIADAPFARLEMATAAHGGRIWLAGGLSPLGEALTDVEVLDPATGEWSDGPSLPSGVHHAALVSDGSRLLLIGGYLGSSFSLPTEIVLVLADGDDTWREGPPLPDQRAAGAAAFDGDRVVYGGGVGVGGVAGDIYALDGDAWDRIGGMRVAREHLAATSDEAGRTWLLGGRVGGLEGNLGTVELVEGDSITELESLPTPRGGVAAFYDADLGACLTGGEAPDRAYTTVECIGASGAPTTLAELNEPHHGHGAVVVDGVAYVLLGGPQPTLSAGPVVETLDLGS